MNSIISYLIEYSSDYYLVPETMTKECIQYERHKLKKSLEAFEYDTREFCEKRNRLKLLTKVYMIRIRRSGLVEANEILYDYVQKTEQELNKLL